MAAFDAVPVPRFRRAEPGDAAALASFMTRTFRETYSAELGGDCRVEDVETNIAEHFGEPIQRAELAEPTLATLVAEIDGALAGYAQLREAAPCPTVQGPRPVELARFYVDRPWHGRGLARALMGECVTFAPAADPLWLNVYQRNARAVAFYAKWGFERAGVQRFVMGDDVQDDWVLVRRPTSPLPPLHPLR